MSVSALSSATSGMARATSQLEHSADRIARTGTPDSDVDVATELTNVLTAKNDFKANAKVASVANDMTGALLDILA